MIQKQLVTIILLCLLWPMASRAQDYRDVVFMKNGSVIKGFYKELWNHGDRFLILPAIHEDLYPLII